MSERGSGMPVEAHDGPPDHGHVAPGPERSDGPRAVHSTAAAVGMPHQPVGRSQGSGSAAPARGTPIAATPMRPPSWTT